MKHIYIIQNNYGEDNLMKSIWRVFTSLEKAKIWRDKMNKKWKYKGYRFTIEHFHKTEYNDYYTDAYSNYEKD